MIRKSTAVWNGDGMHGTGALTTQSGVMTNQAYSFKTRVLSEDGKAGTNPEELLGAAHAGCYAMALAFVLTEAKKPPAELRVTSAVELAQIPGGFAITSIALDVEGRVPGIDSDEFQSFADTAEKGCPVSRALASTPISLSAKLV